MIIFSHFIAEYLLADTQAECSDIESSTIVAVDSTDGCQKAMKSLGVDNPDVIIEDQPSVPKGCYVYTPSNKVYFNQHSTGLDKAEWKFDTRMVCRDFQLAMETAGGNIIYERNKLRKALSIEKYYFHFILTYFCS